MDPVKTPGFASDCLVMGGKWGWLPLNPIVEKAAPSPNLLSTGTGFIHSFIHAGNPNPNTIEEKKSLNH